MMQREQYRTLVCIVSVLCNIALFAAKLAINYAEYP